MPLLVAVPWANFHFDVSFGDTKPRDFFKFVNVPRSTTACELHVEAKHNETGKAENFTRGKMTAGTQVDASTKGPVCNRIVFASVARVSNEALVVELVDVRSPCLD